MRELVREQGHPQVAPHPHKHRLQLSQTRRKSDRSDVALSRTVESTVGRTVESEVDDGCGRRVVGRCDDRINERCMTRDHRLKQSHQITMLAVGTAD